MKKSKKIISLLLALIMTLSVFSIVPFTASAAEADSAATGETEGDYQYFMLEDGTVTLFGYKGSGGNVTVPSTYDGYAVTSISNYTFLNCTGLTSVTIPGCVTSIGKNAFEGCTGLTSVTICDGLTSIDTGAFKGCTALKSVDIPDSCTTIGLDAFYDTAWYDNQPDGLVYAGKAAYKMKGDYSAEIAIKDGTLGITAYAFSGCSNLTSVNIPDTVTSIGDRAFENCTSLKSVTIGNSVTSIGERAFYKCKSLTSLDIPDTVTSIGISAFEGCKALTSVHIPDGITHIGNRVFYDCTSLKSADIPDSVTSIGISAFYNCFNLSSVNIPDGVTSIFGFTFANCMSLKSITIPDTVTSIDGCAFSDCMSLKSITIPDSVTRIGDKAFSGCSNLTSVTIGNSVTSIGGFAFVNCTSLMSVTIPESVTSIGDMAFGLYKHYGYETISGFTIYSYAGNVSKSYADVYLFTFIALSDKADSDTGVSASVTEDTELQVEDVTGSDALGNIQLYGGTILNAYDISLIKDGEAVQPEHMVTVKIPCADKKAKVYRVEADGSLTDMHAVYKDGYLVFTTDHFSVYVVATGAEIEIACLGDVDGDGEIMITDATYIQRKMALIDIPFTLKDTAADADGDGQVTLMDATYIQRWLANLKSNDNIGKPIAA